MTEVVHTTHFFFHVTLAQCIPQVFIAAVNSWGVQVVSVTSSSSSSSCKVYIIIIIIIIIIPQFHLIRVIAIINKCRLATGTNNEYHQLAFTAIITIMQSYLSHAYRHKRWISFSNFLNRCPLHIWSICIGSVSPGSANKERIIYVCTRLCIYMHKALTDKNTLPPYLSSLLTTYKPSHSLRSCNKILLSVPRTNTKSPGQHSFKF